ncbi:MAG: hypothetical protein CL908_26945 [Deltaproteobacteria bacterium]|nr:hypothetical protein [Deltaproteobacteria bacterium]
MKTLDEVAVPEEHHELLSKLPLGMLTTIRQDGTLSTNPVGFLWDGESVRISTLKSRYKYINITHDSRIAFCVQSFSNPLRYIEMRGHASLSDDVDRSFFCAQFRAGSGEKPPEDIDPPGAERAIITLHPVKVSAPTLYGGRFDR